MPDLLSLDSTIEFSMILLSEDEDTNQPYPKTVPPPEPAQVPIPEPDEPEEPENPETIPPPNE